VQNVLDKVVGDVEALQALSGKGLHGDQISFLRAEDRTQEVAGSSPASSMKDPANAGFVFWRTTAGTAAARATVSWSANVMPENTPGVGRAITERKRKVYESLRGRE
jgi:hypothetical protein